MQTYYFHPKVELKDSKKAPKPTRFIHRMPSNPITLKKAIKNMKIPEMIHRARKIEVLFALKKITNEDRRARLLAVFRHSKDLIREKYLS